MNRLAKLTMTTMALLPLGIALPAGSVRADPAKDLMGSWTLVSATIEQGGKTMGYLGANPKGMLNFDGSHFVIVMTRDDLPKFAAPSRENGTADENKAVVQGSIGYFGTYKVSEADNTIISKVDSATFPNWNGQAQKRMFTLSGDQLRYTNSPPSGGAGTIVIVWKRAPVAITTYTN